MSLQDLNLNLADITNFQFDPSQAMADSSNLSTIVPVNYNIPSVYVAPTNSNNIGTAPPVDQITSFLDVLSQAGRRAVTGLTDAYVAKTTAQVNNHAAPAAQVPVLQQNEIIKGVPNILVFGVVAFFVWEALT